MVTITTKTGDRTVYLSAVGVPRYLYLVLAVIIYHRRGHSYSIYVGVGKNRNVRIQPITITTIT